MFLTNNMSLLTKTFTRENHWQLLPVHPCWRTCAIRCPLNALPCFRYLSFCHIIKLHRGWCVHWTWHPSSKHRRCLRCLQGLHHQSWHWCFPNRAAQCKCSTDIFFSNSITLRNSFLDSDSGAVCYSDVAVDFEPHSGSWCLLSVSAKLPVWQLQQTSVCIKCQNVVFNPRHQSMCSCNKCITFCFPKHLQFAQFRWEHKCIPSVICNKWNSIELWSELRLWLPTVAYAPVKEHHHKPFNCYFDAC